MSRLRLFVNFAALELEEGIDFINDVFLHFCELAVVLFVHFDF
jgi:hypothetical protein